MLTRILTVILFLALTAVPASAEIGNNVTFNKDASALNVVPASKSAVNWETDLAAGVHRATDAKKPALILYVTDSCKYCRQMRKHLNDHAGYVNSNFVPVMVDIEKGEGPMIAEMNRVKSVPTLDVVLFTKKTFIHKNGSVGEIVKAYPIGRLIGAVGNPEDLLKALKKVKKASDEKRKDVTPGHN
jgi:thioredoxin-related protein